ncbi:integron integrase [Verrucomicrobium spinosum]|uniref:integron integrase n=1 Tax=Verrucomicrobium spinosum TaxID=2736 RepID=UPI0005C70EED|nr:integron integrase [Verrucomicrobium spinosum]
MQLEDQLRGEIRKLHYSIRTEEAYVLWYRQFVRFHGLIHPETMGAAEVEAFLTHLVKRGVSASTQNQALNALVFLYRQVLKRELENIQAQRAKTSRHLPVVLAVEEIKVLLAVMDGVEALQAGLLYGCGLRVMELLRLRIKDVDLAGGKIEVRDGKGGKDRVVCLPGSAMAALQRQMERAKRVYEQDEMANLSPVWLPDAYATKNPSAGKSWPWFWLFPADKLATDPRSGTLRRHHSHEQRLGRALSLAAKRAGLAKKVTAHTMRHSFATHLLLRGVDIRSVQELLGHADVRTTEIYTQLARAMRGDIRSPLDDL